VNGFCKELISLSRMPCRTIDSGISPFGRPARAVTRLHMHQELPKRVPAEAVALERRTLGLVRPVSTCCRISFQSSMPDRALGPPCKSCARLGLTTQTGQRAEPDSCAPPFSTAPTLARLRRLQPPSATCIESVDSAPARSGRSPIGNCC
jgi:hypothetical protein